MVLTGDLHEREALRMEGMKPDGCEYITASSSSSALLALPDDLIARVLHFVDTPCMLLTINRVSSALRQHSEEPQLAAEHRPPPRAVRAHYAAITATLTPSSPLRSFSPCSCWHTAALSTVANRSETRSAVFSSPVCALLLR